MIWHYHLFVEELRESEILTRQNHCLHPVSSKVTFFSFIDLKKATKTNKVQPGQLARRIESLPINLELMLTFSAVRKISRRVNKKPSESATATLETRVRLLTDIS